MPNSPQQDNAPKRQAQLEVFKRLLSAPDGVALLDELDAIWEPDTLLGDTPEDTAYNVGLRDAYKFLIQLQKGAFIRDE